MTAGNKVTSLSMSVIVSRVFVGSNASSLDIVYDSTGMGTRWRDLLSAKFFTCSLVRGNSRLAHWGRRANHLG